MKTVLNGFAVICQLVFQKAHRLIHVTAKGYSLQTFLGRNTVHQKKTMSDSDMHFGLLMLEHGHQGFLFAWRSITMALEILLQHYDSKSPPSTCDLTCDILRLIALHALSLHQGRNTAGCPESWRFKIGLSNEIQRVFSEVMRWEFRSQMSNSKRQMLVAQKEAQPGIADIAQISFHPIYNCYLLLLHGYYMVTTSHIIPHPFFDGP